MSAFDAAKRPVRRPVRLETLLLPVLALLLGAPATAAELFRYENEDGIVVLSSSLPPQFATRGYTVIDERGRVVREVKRQLTPEEIRQREAARAAEEAERIAAEAQRARDEELVRLYGSPDDVTRAMERRVASIEGAIRTVESNIQRLRNQKRNLERRAADYERSGREIPEALIDNIRVLDEQVAERQEEIAQREREIEAARDEFARDRDRVRYLLGFPEEASGA
ncbi:MAG: DUF4124 domain-containing protein [Pseudomonadales bacterium]|jgi:hypothetical protein|nr:DUF4124 domain-containing protein [Pseudomonadales bacterium]